MPPGTITAKHTSFFSTIQLYGVNSCIYYQHLSCGQAVVTYRDSLLVELVIVRLVLLVPDAVTVIVIGVFMVPALLAVPAPVRVVAVWLYFLGSAILTSHFLF